ncbi:MAG: hypothetical protein JST16_15145 [Bdellovibrionales bacterium]|nr:hypothetical protein [Bdellovibrionales bacterium]
MKTVLARYTEWAWMQGRVQSPEDIATLALSFYQWIESHHGRQTAAARREGVQQIEIDMRRTYLALSYGGRSRATLPAPRQQFLVQQALTFNW